MPIIKYRAQVQSIKGKIDRIFSITCPPFDRDELKRLRGTWFQIDERSEVNEQSSELLRVCVRAAFSGVSQKCLKVLDSNKGKHVKYAVADALWKLFGEA